MKAHPGEELILELDSSVYCLDAVRSATYDFGGKASIKIAQLAPEKIRIKFIPHQSLTSSVETLVSEFYDLLLDHQVRITINKDFKTIREIIVAQAFQPCENLQEIIDLVKP
jgi:His-Xaa-Ser system protein HxsD